MASSSSCSNWYSRRNLARICSVVGTLILEDLPNNCTITVARMQIHGPLSAHSSASCFGTRS